jgi:hypothetical protein
MQDLRARVVAWSIASLLILAAAGGYVYWVKRSRAVMPARSLTAANPRAPHSANEANSTRTLHVDGCREDFTVKVGELVEPRVVPGASPEQFREVYGKESAREARGTLTWKRDPFTLMAEMHGPSSADEARNSIHLALNQGHVVETLDGIELGIDSFGTIFHKMRDRKVEVHERIARSDQGWTLIVSMFSACGRGYRSEYTRTLPSDAETDRLIAPRKAAPGSNQPVTGLLRSDVFMNKDMFDYAMVPSNGKDDAAEGQPSEHD